uniref:BED-type domain-containing protein n=1 Tax=Opuntia streptacantha TaxID=393608 RepID=A0A7C8ZHK5_OPUST
MASGQSEPSPCSTTPNMETTNPTPTSNTDANVDSCGTSHDTEDKGDTLVLRKERKFISKIWTHYNYEVISDVTKAICKYCKKKLSGASKNGTKHLKDYHENCPMKRHRDIVSDFTQKKIENRVFR